MFHLLYDLFFVFVLAPNVPNFLHWPAGHRSNLATDHGTEDDQEATIA